MASLALRNAHNLKDAQWRWDNMEPPVEPDLWIETEPGQAWLKESVDALLYGRDVMIRFFNSRIEVKAADFITTFGKKAADIYACDPKNDLEWALARGIPFAGGEQVPAARP